MARKRGKQAVPDDRGNFISEWFGHRVFPEVVTGGKSIDDQQKETCPFLTLATQSDTPCVKAQNAKGVCSVNSASNGERQDWLVCPHRVLGSRVLQDATNRLFGVPPGERVLLWAAPLMRDDAQHSHFREWVEGGHRGFVYIQTKLGGEISLAPTDRSPEVSFDTTIAELAPTNGGMRIAGYAVLEVQTMDFHGTYRHAVKNLQDALRLHAGRFPSVVQQNPQWLSEKVEGPNIANVFKRTFYQMVLKFQIAGHKLCSGCVIAIPRAVWDSWQRHLGRPALERVGGNVFRLPRENGTQSPGRAATWIYVFDLESAAKTTPSPVKIDMVISADAASLAYYALRVAPLAAIEAGGAADRLLEAVRNRLLEWLPEIVA